MLTLDYKDSYNQKPIAIALGFFDSVHIGHREIISKCRDIAAVKGYASAVMTFRNNPHQNLNKATDLIYTYEERLKVLRLLELDLVINSVFDDAYMRTSADDFLQHLKHNFNIAYIACGKDYRFGHFGKGDVNLLSAFCKANGIELFIAPDVYNDDIKVSTTKIREYLINGDINNANKLLFTRYFIDGTVTHGNKVGKMLLFPTANIDISSQKLKVQDGVYVTCTTVHGKKYLSVTNYGKKPTFNDLSYKIETHILNFNKDIYGENITIEFINKIRDTKKFTSVEELKMQISMDIKAASKYSI